ncbi:hypothetical protein P7C71_g1451, partial [Lecanoromycetidae sp. Uapishka_2]
MQLQLLLLAALSSLASSAPYPWRFQPWDPATRQFLGAGGIDGRRRVIQEEMPHVQSCDNYDISTAQMPPLPSALPPPTTGLKPFQVALGRGTQNYTCQASDTNSSAVPVAIGAVASLYDISCYATLNQSLTNTMTQVAIHHDCPTDERVALSPFGATATLLGHHYFPDTTTATFNLNTVADQLGIAFSKKANSTAAPTTGSNGSSLNGPGLDGVTYNATAVPWLKLMAETPSKFPTLVVGQNTNNIAEIYRINTVGGSPPPNCAAFPKGGSFQLQYSAEYWFWSS